MTDSDCKLDGAIEELERLLVEGQGEQRKLRARIEEIKLEKQKKSTHCKTLVEAIEKAFCSSSEFTVDNFDGLDVYSTHKFAEKPHVIIRDMTRIHTLKKSDLGKYKIDTVYHTEIGAYYYIPVSP